MVSDTCIRTEQSSAWPFQQYQTSSILLTKSPGTNPPSSSPTAHSNYQWVKSMYYSIYRSSVHRSTTPQTFFPAKWVFIATVVIFEIGSIVCAAAPNSPAFIVGRAISGIGSAGTFTGANLIFVDLLPLEKRAKFLGFIGATFGLASVAGPLLGGVFTTKATWRWCFGINGPIGGLAILGILLILPAKSPPRKNVGLSMREWIWQFDPVGTVLLLPGLILLLLALQWGGIQYAWSSARIVVLLVLGILFLVAFAASQVWSGNNGVIPPRIFNQRSILAATAVSLTFGSTLIILAFYLPIWFQAIKGQSAVGAGIKLLPYFLSTVFFVISSGFVVSKLGYYTPVCIVGTSVLVVACGLLSTWDADTIKGEWVGYQVSSPTTSLSTSTDRISDHRRRRYGTHPGKPQQRSPDCPGARRHTNRYNHNNICTILRRRSLRHRLPGNPVDHPGRSAA